MGERAYLSIGEVLSLLKDEFPDITISKIRFLESQGLLDPERTPSGYRKFYEPDVERLRWILRQQKEHYLPLRVIKEHLEAIDRGLEPPALGANGPKVPRALVAAEGLPAADAFLPEVSEIRLSRKELLSAAGLEPEQLDQLEQYGLLSARGGSHYDGDALVVAKTVAEMGRFGIEPRHLRAFKTAADREVGLLEQVAAPIRRSREAGAEGRAEEVVTQIAALSVRLHAMLVKGGLRGLR